MPRVVVKCTKPSCGMIAVVHAESTEEVLDELRLDGWQITDDNDVYCCEEHLT